ncbi:DNA-3-methyladenine glycosylase I [Oceanobacter mangrovi]|uniref:DNA-3-methyladenine glycosylase I n=1 Tax=Oceanobacter mangrovi TaxID=2862510 RepID=UPI001C8D43C4|nr:DNA-3-methyladenine glycosylase I [Oceanobacter mangrovi]
MISFGQIEDQAAMRHGGMEALKAMLQFPALAEDVAAIPDDRWLSEACRIVMQAGFNWEQVDRKWPAFEVAFGGFQPDYVAGLSDEQLEDKMASGTIVKHWPKIKAFRANAALLSELGQQYGSVGSYFSGWRNREFGEHLLELQQRGDRLGGKTGAIWLRRMGVDSFIPTPAVEKALKEFGVVERAPSSRKAWTEFQPILNQWLDETGESLNYISQMLARSCGEVYAEALNE